MYNGGHLRVTHRRAGPSGGPFSSPMSEAFDRPLIFGSPSYPTPLDRIRSARRERTAQLGLCGASFNSEIHRRCSSDTERSTTEARKKPGFSDGVGGVLMHANRLREAGRRWLSRDKDEREDEDELEDDEDPLYESRRSGVHCALEDFTAIAQNLKLTFYIEAMLSHCEVQGCRGINDVSFSCVGAPPISHTMLDGTQTLGESWALYDYMLHSASRVCPASTVRNPNKALCTISARTSEILTANEMAVALFAVSEEELIGRRLSEFVKLKYKNTHVMESHLETESGQLVEISGRVLECEDSTGLRIPVSMWLTHLSSGQDSPDKRSLKCLVALEPVERLTALLLLSPTSQPSENVDEEEDGWTVTSCDQQALALFECSETNELVGQRLDQFITSLEEMSSRKKRDNIGNKKVKLSITGRTKLGKPFPCFAIVQKKSMKELLSRSDNPAFAQLVSNASESEETSDASGPWLLTLWLFANISGLVTVRSSDGCIHSCNSTLAQMLFGYSEAQLIGQTITDIIPNFYCPEMDITEDDTNGLLEEEDESDFRLPPVDEDDLNETTDSLQNTSELLSEARAMLAELAVGKMEEDTKVNFNCNAIDGKNTLCPESQSTPMKSGQSTVKAITPDCQDNKPPRAPVHSLSTSPTVREGCFQGRGRHKDGSLLELIYAVRNVDLLDKESRGTLTVVWVSRNPERQTFAPAFSLSTSSPFWSREASRDPGGYQATASVYSDMLASASDAARTHPVDRSWSYFSVSSRAGFNASTFSPLPQSTQHSPPLRPRQTDSIQEDPESDDSVAVVNAGVDSIMDPLERDYEPLVIIGKGAFGFVRLARCRKTRTEVVVKHIRKSKLGDSPSQFSEDPTNAERVIPREAAILMSLDHPNIVKVIACHEGRDFWHMVMPKHGDGMDLFEFIDRSPRLDEPLVSYIFRQLVSAVHYLHRFSIVHRDIKDENIILNDKFVIKLIDFGAAAKLVPGKKFRVFCGTMEFCSPEILLGNEYRGPEADVWSMGITLYTLMFGENPFYDHEETIHGVLKPPFKISPKLLDLLSIMLTTDPAKRADVAMIRVHPWLTQFIDIEKYKFDSVLPNHDFVGNTGSDFRQYSQESNVPLPRLTPQVPGLIKPQPNSIRSQSDSGVPSSPQTDIMRF